MTAVRASGHRTRLTSPVVPKSKREFTFVSSRLLFYAAAEAFRFFEKKLGKKPNAGREASLPFERFLCDFFQKVASVRRSRALFLWHKAHAASIQYGMRFLEYLGSIPAYCNRVLSGVALPCFLILPPS